MTGYQKTSKGGRRSVGNISFNSASGGFIGNGGLIVKAGPAGPVTLLSGLSVQPDGKINLNGWTDSRAVSLWVPDYNGVLTEIPGGTPLVVDSGTGRTPRFDGTDYWATDPGGTPLPLTGEWVFEHWPGSTNYFLNSFAPATQTITLSDTVDYTLSVHGAGSVDIAAGTAVGTGWGTATDGSPVTVNITTAGSVTCTVTGSPTAVQLENQPFASPVIQTTGAALTRDSCAIDHTTAGAIDSVQGVVMVTFTLSQDHLSLSSGNHFRTFAYSLAGSSAMYAYDGTNVSGINPGLNLVAGSKWIAATRWDLANNEMQLIAREAGTSTWHVGSLTQYNGGFPYSGKLLPFGNSLQSKILNRIEILNKSLTLSELQDRYSLANLGY